MGHVGGGVFVFMTAPGGYVGLSFCDGRLGHAGGSKVEGTIELVWGVGGETWCEVGCGRSRRRRTV